MWADSITRRLKITVAVILQPTSTWARLVIDSKAKMGIHLSQDAVIAVTASTRSGGQNAEEGGSYAHPDYRFSCTGGVWPHRCDAGPGSNV